VDTAFPRSVGDRRCETANEKPVVATPLPGGPPTFVPIKLLVLNVLSAAALSDLMAKPARQMRMARRNGNELVEWRQGIARR
jgi:hypothetical protein